MWNLNPSTGNPATDEARARRLVRFLQIVFLAIALFNLDGPFLSYHYERQNQTFDTACHVFNEGWNSVFTPKTSFSFPGYEARPFTVARQEVPFHGVLAWPLVKVFGHARAAVRVISILFALWSIRLLYLILRQWLGPGMALAGAALWSFSPMLLHFGTIPMPDILCTAGILAAFWFASNNNLPASSGCFLFAILAKISIIVFGLPVLTALLVARNCKTLQECARAAFCWGVIPLIGIISWLSLEFMDPDTPWTIAKMMERQGSEHPLLTAKFYEFVLAILIPYGLGFIGILGVGVALAKKCASQINPWVKWTLLVSNFLYIILVVSKVAEPQYLLPSLAWLILMATFGIDYLTRKTNCVFRWQAGAVLVVCLHVLAVGVLTLDFKASRLPDYATVEKAAAAIPAGARVIVAYPFYGAGAAVWLNHNVLAINHADELETELPRLKQNGFSYLVLMDVKTRTRTKGNQLKTLAAIFHLGRQPTTGRDPFLSDYALPTSLFCQYCDPRFARVFSSDFVIVYNLSSPISKATEER